MIYFGEVLPGLELNISYCIMRIFLVNFRLLCNLNVSNYFVCVLFPLVFVYARRLQLCINADFIISHYTVESARK
jgi:hypothetical protein